MKKLLLFVSTILLILGLGNINAKAFSYKKVENINGIQIDYYSYNKLKSIGYSDESMKFLTRDEYEKVEGMNIISTIQTVEYYYDDEKECTPKTFINPNKDIVDNSGDSGVKHSEVEDSIVTSATRKMTLTAIYYYDEGNGARFEVGIDIKWLKIPSFLGRDLMVICKPDQLNYARRYIGSGQYPDFYAKISNGISSYQVNPLDTDSYKLNDKGIIVELPSISSKNIAQLNCSMRCDFVPNNRNIIAVFCQGSHLHQEINFNIDWNGINISTTPPFVEFSASLKDKVDYSPISTIASFENISL